MRLVEALACPVIDAVGAPEARATSTKFGGGDDACEIHAFGHDRCTLGVPDFIVLVEDHDGASLLTAVVLRLELFAGTSGACGNVTDDNATLLHEALLALLNFRFALIVHDLLRGRNSGRCRKRGAGRRGLGCSLGRSRCGCLIVGLARVEAVDVNLRQVGAVEDVHEYIVTTRGLATAARLELVVHVQRVAGRDVGGIVAIERAFLEANQHGAGVGLVVVDRLLSAVHDKRNVALSDAVRRNRERRALIQVVILEAVFLLIGELDFAGGIGDVVSVVVFQRAFAAAEAEKRAADGDADDQVAYLTHECGPPSPS